MSDRSGGWVVSSPPMAGYTRLDRVQHDMESILAIIDNASLDGVDADDEIADHATCLVEELNAIVPALLRWAKARASGLIIDRQGEYAGRLADSESELLAALRGGGA